MPIRSRTHSINVKRMNSFASELSDRINSVRQANEEYDLLVLEGVGVVVVGERKMPTRIVVIPTPPSEQVDGPSLVAVEKLKEILSKMEDQQVNGTVSESVIKNILVEKLAGVGSDGVRSLRDAIKIAGIQHKMECDGASCSFLHALSLLESAIDSYSVVQQN